MENGDSYRCQLYHASLCQTTGGTPFSLRTSDNEAFGCLSRRMIHRIRPSSVRVFGRSMYFFAVGWAVAVGWLWIAEVQQHVTRHGEPPPSYAMSTMRAGAIPTIAIALLGTLVDRWAGRTQDPVLQRMEWRHAFWWSLVPNALLLLTVWVMIQAAR